MSTDRQIIASRLGFYTWCKAAGLTEGQTNGMFQVVEKLAVGNVGLGDLVRKVMAMKPRYPANAVSSTRRMATQPNAATTQRINPASATTQRMAVQPNQATTQRMKAMPKVDPQILKTLQDFLRSRGKTAGLKQLLLGAKQVAPAAKPTAEVDVLNRLLQRLKPKAIGANQIAPAQAPTADVNRLNELLKQTPKTAKFLAKIPGAADIAGKGWNWIKGMGSATGKGFGAAGKQFSRSAAGKPALSSGAKQILQNKALGPNAGALQRFAYRHPIATSAAAGYGASMLNPFGGSNAPEQPQQPQAQGPQGMDPQQMQQMMQWFYHMNQGQNQNRWGPLQ